MKKTINNKGFTLVEILAVVTLIALVTVLAVSGINAANRKTKERILRSKVTTAESALYSWATDNENCFRSKDAVDCVIGIEEGKGCKVDQNIVSCSITIGELANMNLIKYDNEEEKIVIDPTTNKSMNDEPIEFVYDSVKRNFIFEKNSDRILKVFTSTTSKRITTASDSETGIFPIINGDSWVKSISVKVNVKASKGLAEGGKVRYGWSLRQDTLPKNYTDWITLPYADGATTTSFMANGSDLNGEYYLWIEPEITTKDEINLETTVADRVVRFDNTPPSRPNNMILADNNWNVYTIGTTSSKDLYVVQSSKANTNICEINDVDLNGATDTLSGVARFEISNNNSDWHTYNYDCEDSMYKLSENGTHTRYVRACDNAENCGESVILQANIDKIAPTVTITATKNNSGDVVMNDTWSNEGLKFGFEASGTGKSGYTIYYCKDTSNNDDNACNPNVPYSGPNPLTSFTENTGIYNIRYKIVTGANISSEVQKYIAKVDTKAPTKPEMTFVNGDWETYNPDKVNTRTLYAAQHSGIEDNTCTTQKGAPRSTDDISGIDKYQISVDGTRWETYIYDCGNDVAGNTLYKMEAYTTHTRYFRACDYAGNCSDVTTVTATIENGQPVIGIMAYKFDSSREGGIGEELESLQTYTSDGTFLVKNGEQINGGITFMYGAYSPIGIKSIVWKPSINGSDEYDTGKELEPPFDTNTLIIAKNAKFQLVATSNDNKVTTVTVIANLNIVTPTAELEVYKAGTEEGVGENEKSDVGLDFIVKKGSTFASDDYASVFYCVDRDDTCVPNIQTEAGKRITDFRNLTGIYFFRYYIVNELGKGSFTSSYMANVEVPNVKVTAYNYDDATKIIGPQAFFTDGTIDLTSSWLPYGVKYKIESAPNAAIKSAIWSWNKAGTYTENENMSSENQTAPLNLKYPYLKESGYRVGKYVVTFANEQTITVTLKAKIDNVTPVATIIAYKKGTIDVVVEGSKSDTGLDYKITKSNATVSNATIYYCKETATTTCTFDFTSWNQITSGNRITNYNNDTKDYIIKYVVINESGLVSPVYSYNAQFKESDLLVDAIKPSECYEPKTVPGRDIADTDEGMPCADDDYGKSYYYRGVQDNNYVVFSGMCWRIVRIDGKDNVKLVLFNGSGPDCSNFGDEKATLGVPDDLNGYCYNGVDFMNGGYNKSINGVEFDCRKEPNTKELYDLYHANTNESAYLSILRTWYNHKINKSDKNLLADVVWCNDISLGSEIRSDWSVSYSPRDRLFDKNSATPTFKCLDSSGYDKNLSRFTAGTSVDPKGNGALSTLYYADQTEKIEYKIGLLTADEVAFAGSNTDIDNTSYYLYQNTQYMFGRSWLTISPYGIYVRTGINPMAKMFGVLNGRLHPSETSSNNLSIRPAVALKPDVTFTNIGVGEKGSITNPYIIGISKDMSKLKNKSNDGTLLSKILPDEAIGPKEKDAWDAPKTTGLFSAIDDYGTSYYYRGEVQDNYVIFANKCWQILRIDGKGNIKLVLYNNDSNNCNSSYSFAFMSKFNENKYSPAFVGYMYGNPKGSTYDSKFENIHESTILTNLKNWYLSNIYNKGYNDYLADVVWCNDKSICDEGFGVSCRLGASVTFSCPNSYGTNPNLSRYTAGTSVDPNGNGKLKINGIDYKIGLITFDEYYYSGFNYDHRFNTSSFLYRGKRQFTMSPYWSRYNDGYTDNDSVAAYVGVMYHNSAFYNSSSNVNLEYPVSPAIALKPNVKVSSGSGTKTDPYIISGLK